MKWFVVASGQFQDLSDGNERWDISVAPRYALARSRWINLDAGVSGSYLRALKDLPDGYYDPSRFESYQAMAYPYFKFAENVGVGLSVGAGVQRQAWQPFFFGGSLTAQGDIGIYRAWTLRVMAAATHNQRQATGAFGGYTGSVVVVRRF
jgi:hypothetical protein